MKTTKYKLIFANQSLDTAQRYEMIRETKMYLFLKEITSYSPYTFRVHKKTLSIKGIKDGENSYQFDVPSAISLRVVD